MDQITKLLNENAVLPLWPEAGQILGLKRGVTYEAARSGEIRTIRIGRLYKVPTAWLRQKLGLNEPGTGAA
jgi:excisionase family DNA binding protein